MGPTTGNGNSLYAIIGQASRGLGRNLAVAGRVIEGMEYLSALPRGTGPLGFCEKAEQRTPIVSVRLAADLPPAERPKVEVLRTDSASFAKLIEPNATAAMRSTPARPARSTCAASACRRATRDPGHGRCPPACVIRADSRP
ncbi:hypothetical protein [Oleiagrimonas soli]|uniref:PPIase cyclophilin-type domain-containing protein n=1 Tax=Oleiagrimonas soli TaxID=1543381 RepID=A0A841KLE0_9GAMM|nr:hypothetical protein [Oleiagrimonas soli]